MCVEYDTCIFSVIKIYFKKNVIYTPTNKYCNFYLQISKTGPIWTLNPTSFFGYVLAL